MLYPADVRPDYVGVTDLEQALLGDVPVLGPPGGRWLLKVNHGGSSLEAAVAASHVRNVLLSAGLLGVLVISIALVVFNARRQVSLAREHLYFVAGVSHELRTPLSVIAAAADNLAERAVGEDPRVRDYGALILREVRRLKDMIENVLQFAQSASAAQPRVRADVDMAALIGEVLDSCVSSLPRSCRRCAAIPPRWRRPSPTWSSTPRNTPPVATGFTSVPWRCGCGPGDGRCASASAIPSPAGRSGTPGSCSNPFTGDTGHARRGLPARASAWPWRAISQSSTVVACPSIRRSPA